MVPIIQVVISSRCYCWTLQHLGQRFSVSVTGWYCAGPAKHSLPRAGSHAPSQMCLHRSLPVVTWRLQVTCWGRFTQGFLHESMCMQEKSSSLTTISSAWIFRYKQCVLKFHSNITNSRYVTSEGYILASQGISGSRPIKPLHLRQLVWAGDSRYK